jgi:hypothetical protein
LDSIHPDLPGFPLLPDLPIGYAGLNHTAASNTDIRWEDCTSQLLSQPNALTNARKGNEPPTALTNARTQRTCSQQTPEPTSELNRTKLIHGYIANIFAQWSARHIRSLRRNTFWSVVVRFARAACSQEIPIVKKTQKCNTIQIA